MLGFFARYTSGIICKSGDAGGAIADLFFKCLYRQIRRSRIQHPRAIDKKMSWLAEDLVTEFRTLTVSLSIAATGPRTVTQGGPALLVPRRRTSRAVLLSEHLGPYYSVNLSGTARLA